MKGYILYPTYETIDGETVVQLFGRLENGESFLVIKKFQPHLFIRTKDARLSSMPAAYTLEKTSLKNFKGESVSRILTRTSSDLGEIEKKVHKGIPTYESDVRPQYHFIIENNLLGGIEIEGEYETSEKVNRVYKEPKISAAEFKPKLKIASIDTESDKKGKLYCIGIYTEDFRKTFMVTKHESKGIVACASVEECLQKFREELLRLDPDIITGWNVIDFDLVYLREQFRKHKIRFDIGRTDDEPRIRVESNFFKKSSVDIPGRQVLDGIYLMRDPFIQEAPSIKHAEFDSLTLEDVSQAILKKGKLLKGKDRHKEIEKLYTDNTAKSHEALADYNLMDCELVYEILEETKTVELAVERSQLTGLPIDKITASIAAFDSLYIREARKRSLVSPTTDYKQKEARIKGGYVQSLKSGLYKNVVVLDFKSLYPSIIRTFNIDPASYLEGEEKGCIKAPNGACFKNEEGVLPQILERLHQAREKAKKEKRELSSYAIKTIMNSFFGVLANPNCRYFNLNIANAITYFGQEIIKLTAKEIEKKGYKVIYSDTDSVFVETNLDVEKANALGRELEEYICKFYEKYVKENYNRTSYLELEFEKQYIRFMIPQVRGKEEEEIAAKKRYAGLVDKGDGKETLEVVGLEAIRGDWTDAAQDFQLELLNKLFHDEPIEEFIKSYIKKIRDGKLDAKLIYRKSIRKSLDEYTKTTPPHVKAARKLDKLDSNVISYYITEDGPEPIQKLKHKIDYEHYIEKQINPIANQILALWNKNVEAITQKSKQSTLF